MKLHKILMALAVAAASAGFVSCDDDFDRPPVIVPEATITANTSILDLKAKYWQDSSQDYQTTIGTTDDGKHIIIGGRVVSSDKEGNVYQRIILEDETSAITVRIYSTDLYEKYQYGQEVRIDVTGLLIGTYRGLQMIGTLYNNSIGGMDLDVFTSIAQVNGLPDPALIPEYVTTIPDIVSYKANQQEMMTWQTRLITLNDVEFVDGGKEMFGTPGAANYTTRKLRDAQGNTLDISTSNKCKFVNTVMPTGKGSVRAILSYFGSNWQLVFSDPKTDCTGFEWTDKPVTPDTPGGEPAGEGTLEDPYNAAKALELAKALGENDSIKNVYIKGKVIEIKEFSTQYGNATYTIGDSEGGVTLSIYRGKGLKGGKFTSEDQLQVGAEVVVLGTLVNYMGNTPQMTSGSQLVSYNGQGGTTPEQPGNAVKFRKATSITSGGSYILVIDGKVGTVIGKDLAYGRLELADPASVSGDEITTDAANAIVFTASGSGFTMTDSYGRLLSIDDSHFNNFQLYTEAQPGSVWNVTVDASGEATIVSATHDNIHAVRSGTFNTVAPSDVEKYPTYNAPVVYEKVN